MIVKIDITDIKDDKKAIDERIRKQYPYNPYMPILKKTEQEDGNVYAVVSVIAG